MNGESFAAGIVIGAFLTFLALWMLVLGKSYSPGEGRYYYPWHESETICVQAEKQNCKVEFKKVYVAESRRYDYDQ